MSVGNSNRWPATFTEPDLLGAPLVLRPPRFSDGPALRAVREANRSWLQQWEPTNPAAPPSSALAPDPQPEPDGVAVFPPRPLRLRPYLAVARARVEAARGTAFPWTVCYDGHIAGQVTVWAIAWGSTRTAQVGYWVDRRFAGCNITPTALALIADHCFLMMGLHRLEAGIQPENTASRRVVEKLGFREEGTRVRQVHINGFWRDHVYYAITAEEAAPGVFRRWQGQLTASRPSGSVSSQS